MLPASLAPMVMLTDEQVVQRVLGGDTAVFELLMRRHNRRLFRIVVSVVRNRDEAEDVVQEAYVRAYQHLARFEGRASVATWLSRIAFHEALKRRRHRTRAIGGGEVAPADSPTASPEARSMLTAAMDQLSDALRSVVMLRLVEGLDTRETAQSLRMSESNVKVSLHRARKLLLEHIEEQAIPELRDEFAFDGERCDRVVDAVFRRIGELRHP
jgi:RNA polymerase sigma-70 factor (ECF subfamily)